MFDNMPKVFDFLKQTNAPDIVFNALEKCVDLPERTDFHPEGTTDKHIEIVFNRALSLKPEIKELLFAAIFHDIMKAESGSLKERDQMVWWSNPKHDKQAFYFIHDNEDVMSWMEENDADPHLVAKICSDHMRMKLFLKGERGEKGGMKETKRKAMMEDWGDNLVLLSLFSKMDDMLLKWNQK